MKEERIIELIQTVISPTSEDKKRLMNHFHWSKSYVSRVLNNPSTNYRNPRVKALNFWGYSARKVFDKNGVCEVEVDL